MTNTAEGIQLKAGYREKGLLSGKSRVYKNRFAGLLANAVYYFLGSMAAFGAEYCVQPIIPVIASSFGLNAVQGSLAVSLGLVGMSAAMLLIAGLAPRFDRKLATAVGLIGAAILTIMIGFSGSFEAILGMRLIQGLLLAAFPSLIIAYINEEFEPFNVGTVIGIYISGTTVGGLFGRLVVSAITDFVSWRMGLIVIGILYLAVGIAFFMLLPKPKYQRQRQSGGLQLIKTFHTALANKKLLWIYLVAFLIMGSFVAVFNFISYVLLAPPYSLSQTVVGLLFVVYLFGTFSSTYMGRSDQHGNGRVLILGLLIMLTGGLLTLLQPLVFKFIGLAIFTFGMLGSHSVACGWVGKLNQGDKAQSSSMYMFFYYAGASSLGTLGGVFLESYGWSGVIGMVAAAVIICLLVVVRLELAVRQHLLWHH